MCVHLYTTVQQPDSASVAASKFDHTHLSSRHIECFGGRVDHLVDGLHGEVERHELTDGTKTSLRGKGLGWGGRGKYM